MTAAIQTISLEGLTRADWLKLRRRGIGPVHLRKEPDMSKADWFVVAVLGLVFIGACTVGGWVLWAMRALADIAGV